MPETLWEEGKGLKVQDIADLAKFKGEEDARRASIPATAEDYKTEFSQDFKLPDGWEIKADHPLWQAGKQAAKELGLTQDQFGKLATVLVNDQIRQSETIKAQQRALNDSLGSNSAARVEALHNGLKGFYGDNVGAQMAQMLVTKDIVEAMEKTLSTLKSQGAQPFNPSGRDNGPAKGEIPGYDKMSFEQKMHASEQARRNTQH